MSNGLYIAATAAFAGKNTITMGLALRLQKDGHTLRYMKPFGPLPEESSDGMGDADALFMRDILGLSTPPELMSPVLATQDFKMRAFQGKVTDKIDKVKQAYAQLSKEADLMLVAGSGSIFSGRYCHLDGIRLIRELNLKVLMVEGLDSDLHYDTLNVLKELLGDALIGVVLNNIPAHFLTEIDTLVRPFLEQKGIPVLGVIPNDPFMSSIRVASLVECLGGRIISGQARADKIVENFLIGTMQVENFMTYFKRQKNTAVIVGGDRSDVQLVALEGQCAALILTGNLFPNDIILSRAEALNVPIIILREDTYSVAKKMELLLAQNKLHDVFKIHQGSKLVNAALDFSAIKQSLGLV